MSGWYSANLAIWLVPRAGSILPIRLAHSRRYPILCVRDYINYVVATFHSLIWYLSLNNFSLFTTKINSDMDSGHSESEFYYPDEVERRKWRRKYRFATERKRTKGSVYDGECAKVYFNTMSRKHGEKNRIRPTRLEKILSWSGRGQENWRNTGRRAQHFDMSVSEGDKKERWQIVLIGNATIISKKPATMSKRQELQTEHSQRPKIR